MSWFEHLRPILRWYQLGGRHQQVTLQVFHSLNARYPVVPLPLEAKKSDYPVKENLFLMS